MTRVRSRAGVVLSGLLAITASACGGSSTPTFHPTFDTSPQTPLTAPSGVGLETPSAFVTAPPASSDTTIAIAPKTYQTPTDPCYGLAKTVALLSAPPACQSQWQVMSVLTVPGEDITAASPIPHQAQLAAGVDPTTGAAAALGFYRYEVLSTYLVAHNYTDAMKVLDTPSYAVNDRILGTMLNGGTTTNIPNCSEPTSIRVISVPYTTRQYLQSLGWPAPSATAILTTFGACPGMTFEYRGGASKSYFGNGAAATTIQTGTVRDIAPFGSVWVIDGYGICGVAGLKDVCGV